MDKRAKKLLFDVLESGRSILGWCQGRTFTDYEADRQFRKAVEREFEVIGEALSRLAVADLEVPPASAISRVSWASATGSFTDTTRSTTPLCGASSRATCRH